VNESAHVFVVLFPPGSSVLQASGIIFGEEEIIEYFERLYWEFALRGEKELGIFFSSALPKNEGRHI